MRNSANGKINNLHRNNERFNLHQIIILIEYRKSNYLSCLGSS